MLVIYCCITNHHGLGDLKQHTLIVSCCLYIRYRAQHSWVLCCGSHQAAVKCWAGWWYHQRLKWGKVSFQAFADCWHNLVPGIVGHKSPSCYWLSVGDPSVPTSCHSSLSHGLLTGGLIYFFKLSKGKSVFLRVLQSI